MKVNVSVAARSAIYHSLRTLRLSDITCTRVSSSRCFCPGSWRFQDHFQVHSASVAMDAKIKYTKYTVFCQFRADILCQNSSQKGQRFPNLGSLFEWNFSNSSVASAPDVTASFPPRTYYSAHMTHRHICRKLAFFLRTTSFGGRLFRRNYSVWWEEKGSSFRGTGTLLARLLEQQHLKIEIQNDTNKIYGKMLFIINV